MIEVWDIESKQIVKRHPIDALEQFNQGVVTYDIPGLKDKPKSPKVDKKKAAKSLKGTPGKKPVSPKLDEEKKEDDEQAAQDAKTSRRTKE